MALREWLAVTSNHPASGHSTQGDMTSDANIPFTVPKQGVEWSREGDTLRIRFEDNILVRWSVRRLGIDPSATAWGYVFASLFLHLLAAALDAPVWAFVLVGLLPINLMTATRSELVELELTPERVDRRTHDGWNTTSEERIAHDGSCDVNIKSGMFVETVTLQISGGEVIFEVDDSNEARELRRAVESYFADLERMNEAS